jgi:purine-binding chemotaxis protein CheW
MKQQGSGADAKAESSSMARLAGKFMTFRLANEDYGLPILKVRELIGLMEITRVPGSPELVRGVINLRGKVIPVIDLRTKFGLEAIAATRQSVIIVVQVEAASGPLTLGVLVDEVLEVRDIAAAQIEPPPNFGFSGSELDFILGVGKTEKRVVFLLDIDRVLSSAEVEKLSLPSDHGEAA